LRGEICQVVRGGDQWIGDVSTNFHISPEQSVSKKGKKGEQMMYHLN